MKIALCLHGLVGTNYKYGTGFKKIPYQIGHEHFKRHLFDVNEHVDTFIHTWSTDFEKELKEAYSPVSIIAEEQPEFRRKENLKKAVKASMKGDHSVQQKIDRKQAIHCRWYSARKVLELVKQSEVDYDFILLTRFDVAFLVDFNFSEFDADKFYIQGPPGPKQNGLSILNDLWFFAKPEYMNKFCDLFDCLEKEEYIPHVDSNHELFRKHMITNGLNDLIEYKFKWDWSGASGKILSDTPLVRWHYDEFLEDSLRKEYLLKLLVMKRKEYADSNST